MVGAARFELATPTTPLWCATRLRYAPTGHEDVQLARLGGRHDTRHGALKKDAILAAQNLKNLFKFYA